MYVCSQATRDAFADAQAEDLAEARVALRSGSKQFAQVERFPWFLSVIPRFTNRGSVHRRFRFPTVQVQDGSRFKFRFQFEVENKKVSKIIEISKRPRPKVLLFS